jgi:hypothetical protein
MLDLARQAAQCIVLHRLIEKHGRKGNMMKWREQLNGDCPKRDAHSPHERCDLICPDLPKVNETSFVSCLKAYRRRNDISLSFPVISLKSGRR